jgi:hypothetical protein
MWNERKIRINFLSVAITSDGSLSATKSLSYARGGWQF